MKKAVLEAAVALLAAPRAAAAPEAPALQFDVDPVDGEPGRYRIRATLTDIDGTGVIARPEISVDLGGAAAHEAEIAGWGRMRVSAEAEARMRRIRCEATLTRAGAVVSRHRVTVMLGG